MYTRVCVYICIYAYRHFSDGKIVLEFSDLSHLLLKARKLMVFLIAGSCQNIRYRRGLGTMKD